MNTGIFGEGFPYSNFHDLNMDWIIKIAKDFLDQYSTIQQIISDGETNLTNLTNSGLESLQEKADNLEELLQAWYDTHSNDIANALASALEDISSSLTQALGNITTAKNTAVQQFNQSAQAKAEETIASIPADYSELASDVQTLMSLVGENLNIWEGNRSYSFTRVQEIFLDTPLDIGTYTISAITSNNGTQTDCRIAFFDNNDSPQQVGFTYIQRGMRQYKHVSLTGKAYSVRLYSQQTSSSSTGIAGTWDDIVLVKGRMEIDRYLPSVTDIDYIARYQIGLPFINLISATWTDVTQANFTIKHRNDNSLILNGTPASNSGHAIEIHLPAGEYILSGMPDTSSADTVFYRIVFEDNSYRNYYGEGDNEFTLETEQDLHLWIRWIANATFDNTVISPMIRKKYTQNGTYTEYGEQQVYKPISELINNTPYNWAGKVLNAIGDSIVEHGLFLTPIQQILNLSLVRNYGMGGSSIASRGTEIDTEYPPACTRYTNMNNNADIIIVHAGTNDYTSQVPIGDTDSTDITTFNGALNVMLSGLRDKYPTALIIVSNILDRIQDNNPSRYPIVCQTYRDALEQACIRNKTVFFNSFTETGLDFHKAYYTHSVSDDGLHPNKTGGQIFGRAFAGFINSH